MRDIRQIENSLRGRFSKSELRKPSPERPIRALVLLLAANFGTYDFKMLKPAALALEYINAGTRNHYQNAGCRTCPPLPVASGAGRRVQDAGFASRFQLPASSNLSLIRGDHYYARALAAVAPLGNNEVIRILSEALITVTEGQVCSVPVELPIDTALGQYYEALKKRCALYEAACALASVLAEVNESITLVLKEYAVMIGLAYEAQFRREMAKKELLQLASLAKDTLINLPARGEGSLSITIENRPLLEELADGVVE